MNAEQLGAAWDDRFVIRAMLQLTQTKAAPDPLGIAALLWQRCCRTLQRAAQRVELKECFHAEGTLACIEQLELDCSNAITAASVAQPLQTASSLQCDRWRCTSSTVTPRCRTGVSSRNASHTCSPTSLRFHRFQHRIVALTHSLYSCGCTASQPLSCAPR